MRQNIYDDEAFFAGYRDIRAKPEYVSTCRFPPFLLVASRKEANAG